MRQLSSLGNHAKVHALQLYPQNHLKSYGFRRGRMIALRSHWAASWKVWAHLPALAVPLCFGKSLSMALFLIDYKEDNNSSFLPCFCSPCLYTVNTLGCLFDAQEPTEKFPAYVMNLDIKAGRVLLRACTEACSQRVATAWFRPNFTDNVKSRKADVVFVRQLNAVGRRGHSLNKRQVNRRKTMRAVHRDT